MGFSTADGFWFGVFWIILHLDELYTNRNGNRNSNKYNVYVIKAILAALIKSILIVCEIDDILHTHCLQCERYINAKSKRNRSQKNMTYVHASINCGTISCVPDAFCLLFHACFFFNHTAHGITESMICWNECYGLVRITWILISRHWSSHFATVYTVHCSKFRVLFYHHCFYFCVYCTFLMKCVISLPHTSTRTAKEKERQRHFFPIFLLEIAIPIHLSICVRDVLHNNKRVRCFGFCKLRNEKIC